MELEHLMPHIEALVFASAQAISIKELVELLRQVADPAPSAEKIETGLAAIKEKYATAHYAFELRQVAGGYQFLTKQEFHQTVVQLNGDKYTKKLSSAAMETLAIVAYRQPITKSEIEFIRGVSSDYSVQKLLEKELIYISGRNEDAVGKPLLYSTTKQFMDYLGINSQEQLPQLKEIINADIVIPTEATEAMPELNGNEDTTPSNTEEHLMVDDEGNLSSIIRNS